MPAGKDSKNLIKWMKYCNSKIFDLGKFVYKNIFHKFVKLMIQDNMKFQIKIMFKIYWNAVQCKVRSGRVIYGEEGFRFYISYEINLNIWQKN